MVIGSLTFQQTLQNKYQWSTALLLVALYSGESVDCVMIFLSYMTQLCHGNTGLPLENKLGIGCVSSSDGYLDV